MKQTRESMDKKSHNLPLVALVAAAVLLVAIQDGGQEVPLKAAEAASQSAAKLTPTLVAWISSQAESIIEELEAIARDNAESDKFSVVNYIRYLALYDDLKVIAANDVDKLRWVSKKVKALSRAYNSAVDILTRYLQDLDTKMTTIELNEPKSKQVDVSKDWLQIYQTINYIATHAPRGSNLSEMATKYLQKSPNGNPDKQRATRYKLKTQAFH